MGTPTGINVEYWFRQLIRVFGGTHVSLDWATLAANAWTWITYVGYSLTVVGLFVIIYTTVKLFDLRHHEEEELQTLITEPEVGGGNTRFAHVESLMASQNPSDWRQAIIEADILLDDVLTQQGFIGDGVGEKLKQAESGNFATIRDAWEAHVIRNQIAHGGSAFDLSETLARRTIARYESVFREFAAI